MCLLAKFSMAACTIGDQPAENWVAPNYNITMTTPVSVGKDTAASASLGNSAAAVVVLGALYCGTGNASTNAVPVLYPTKSNVSGIYNSNVAGVGFSASWDSSPQSAWWENQVVTNYWYNYGTHKFMLYLTTTGDTPGAGTINPGQIAKIQVFNPKKVSEVYTLATVTLTNPIVINVKACDVDTSNVDVPLGDVYSSKFTGVGNTVATKDFSVKLKNCVSGTSVKATMTGAQSVDTTDNSVLALSNTGSNGVATGIGVQILYSGTPLSLNTGKTLAATPAGNISYTFSARYYQTLTTVTPGQANAIATLNLTYQ